MKVINDVSGSMISNTLFNAVMNESGGVKKGEIWLSGFVGDEWSDTGVAMKNLKNYVETNGLTKCTIFLNTGGGYVSSAMEIASYMQMSKNVTFKVVNVGIVASAGVIILVTADKAECVDGSLTMIHDPTFDSWGSMKAKDLKNKAAVLEKIKDSIVGVYINKMKKSGVVKNEAETKLILNSMMEEETWMTASETKEMGFVNEVIEGGKIKKDEVSNSINLNICNVLKYNNMSTVKDWLDKLSGKAPVVAVKNAEMDSEVKAALELLKNNGFEMEVEKEAEKEVDALTKAINLLKEKGFKIEEKAAVVVDAKNEKAVVVAVPKNETSELDERMGKMEALLVKLAENSTAGSTTQKPESRNQSVRSITMPTMNVGGDDKGDSKTDDVKESVFAKIKNGKEVEGAMNKIADCLK